MTNYIILAFCIVIVLSYIFDITAKFSKIPGVIFLIAMGVGIRILSDASGLETPDFEPFLPVLGTLGLIMIVMEASLDIELKKNKKSIIVKSISSAFILLVVFVAIFSYILVRFLGFSLRDSLLNSIPLGIISSSIAIPAAAYLNSGNKEFVVYESSFSDIFGIMIFDMVLLSHGTIGGTIFKFALDGIFTLIIALLSTAALAFLLHRTKYHVNYVIILTSIILIYSLAKLIHLPALLLVLIFGLVLSNNKFLENNFVKKFIDFTKFRNDILSFRKILGELTFLVRSFFFIMFGYYTEINNLINPQNLLIASGIAFGLILLRWIFFRQVLRLPAIPLVFFTPRGLITILLFLSIPVESKIPLVSEEIITLVILITIIVLTIGNILQKKEISDAVPVTGQIDQPGDAALNGVAATAQSTASEEGSNSSRDIVT
ncbi:MAG: sodium:proton antiporter [Bacteroidota bacterium]